ncbi:hypothetical protein IE4872_PD00126 (plasmid) [Rhizobium gallicum]|uniref:Uncharacterized protein n=1 Tax=Rhizobium gallicum TaxID=56730 RepID=A0A1L5NS51_9HYPH|nr:hypothetical protein IE4872_PD00126 [Rhizobium gallicum]
MGGPPLLDFSYPQLIFTMELSTERKGFPEALHQANPKIAQDHKAMPEVQPNAEVQVYLLSAF